MKKTLSFLISLFLLQYLFAQNPPVANNDTFSINKNNTVTLPVLSNDYDVDGNSLTVSILIPPLNGTASVSGNQIVYLPNLNYVGNDWLTYVICDSTNLCDTAVVFITINNVNNAPVAVDDNFTVPENSTTALPVASNDYDPDGDPLAVSILISPSNGTATVTGTQVSYTPNSFYFGTDSFVYIICDTASCDTATVYIIVNGSNSAPVGTDDNFAFTDTLRAAALDVLGNDTDSEGDSLFVSTGIDLDNINNLGSLSVDSSTGNLIFTRNGITCGTETFAYVVCDQTSCDTANVTIIITCPENIFLTEGFSPDGDGMNDRLVFTRLEYFAPASLKVFNRYGNMVYMNDDYRNDWDGTYMENNKPLPDGTYFYILELADKRNYNNYLIINR